MLESPRFMRSRNTDHPMVIFKNAFPPTVIGAMVVQVALINGVLILGGVFGGIYLDRQFGSKPLLTLALGIGGAIAAGVLTFVAAMRTVKRAREAYLKYADGRQQETSEAHS
ncbi:MAG: AtpZ/AtpI family protein [Chloroflexi bacterium]|nr:AtpZ/AtpI family protein [Chloroflexota bacterium]